MKDRDAIRVAADLVVSEENGLVVRRGEGSPRILPGEVRYLKGG